MLYSRGGNDIYTVEGSSGAEQGGGGKEQCVHAISVQGLWENMERVSDAHKTRHDEWGLRATTGFKKMRGVKGGGEERVREKEEGGGGGEERGREGGEDSPCIPV